MFSNNSALIIPEFGSLISFKPERKHSNWNCFEFNTTSAERNGLDNKIKTDIVPEKFSAGGILNELARFNPAGKKILLPSSSLARDELKNGLISLGAEVSSIPVYNVILPLVKNLETIIKKLNKVKPDVFLFTSPSSFNNYLQLLNLILLFLATDNRQPTTDKYHAHH